MDLKWILDTMPVGLWVGRVPDGEVLFANPEFRTILGMDAPPGVTIEAAPDAYGLFDRAGRPYPAELLPFSRVVKARAPVTVDDIVIHRADGARVNVRAFGYPHFDTSGMLEHVGVAFLDITAEVQAELARAETEARLALAVNHAPIVIWSADRSGVITLSEGAGLVALGVKPGQLVGANIFELYGEHPSICTNIRRGLAGESFSYNTQIGRVVFDTHLVPLRDTAGEVTGVAGLSHDVTEMRALQATAIQNDRAIALGTLASSVAHEINNPLTYILGHLELLGDALDELEGGLDDESSPRSLALLDLAARMREAVETARSGTQRIAVITAELGTFSRPARGHDETVDPQAVVHSVLNLVRKDLEARAQLQLGLDAAAPIRGNAARLVQVVLNLVVNALQSLPADRNGEGRIFVNTRNEGDDVVIEVADNGHGVPPSERERIFEPFVTTKDIGQGTGLGLFVSRNIVEGIGGRLFVTERPGGGALFRIVLPAARDLAAARPVSAPVEAARESRPSAHVLIIDDDLAVARLLCARLRTAGYQATVETEAARAVEQLVAGASFDLVYCDLMMQGMTGMDVAHALATRAPAQFEKLVFMTGGAFTPRARDFRSQHAARFVDKPFDILAETARRLRPGP